MLSAPFDTTSPADAAAREENHQFGPDDVLCGKHPCAKAILAPHDFEN